jgi:drug/metabolite transporter (DMT)-like permease
VNTREKETAVSAASCVGAPEKSKAIRMLFLATAFWSASFPVMKALSLEQQKLLPGANTWFLTSLGVMYRFGAAGVVMLFLCWRRAEKISRLEIEQGLWLAVFGAGGILFQMDGLAYTEASTSAFLTQCYCVFLPVWTVLIHRHVPSLKLFLCIIIVLLGVAMLAGVNFHSLKLGRGELETVIASLLFAGQILLLESPRYNSNRATYFSTVMFFGMAMLCVPLVIATAPSARACIQAYASPAACAFLTLLVGLCTIGGYMLMNRWQRRVTATEAGLIYCIEPVLASALALFLPGWISKWADLNYTNEELTVRLIIGGGLVTVANVFLQSRWLERKRN